ncbi:MAG: glycoside hydrolase family 2 TIM barrel-domain containing protein, partial [Dehalococcoidia bacterium]|nr:glycoside hydrolase family 2 TIM barrel-domain containing protein [Dehalococcoidia bacterium]
ASVGFFPALADYDNPPDEQETAAQIADALMPAQSPEQAAVAAEQGGAGGPSKVKVTGSDYVYSYAVNSRIEKMRGVGYNALYSGLPTEERAARYDWDFAEMKAAGVNTILGWGLQRFDELILTKAQEYGLGVVMPYRISGDSDFTSASHQQQVLEDVRRWVERYKSYPALRMWGIGNEVIHAINPQTAQAKAFGEFYVRLADEVHALDPDHPVLYRDAEDINIGPIKEALLKKGIHRPWFVYGGNYFTSRVCEAIPDWPKKGMNISMLVSEFAPSGLSPEGRPQGYLRMLRCITKDAPFVLGAFAYVWSTEGPEAVDRVFGLVNAQGEPVDRSLWALGRAFHRTSAPGYWSSHSPR